MSLDCSVDYVDSYGSSTYYTEYDCGQYMTLHRLETSAASISMFASFGWAWSWYYTYYRKPGRGFTWQVCPLVCTALLCVYTN